jgi:hypothetical protein
MIWNANGILDKFGELHKIQIHIILYMHQDNLSIVVVFLLVQGSVAGKMLNSLL